MEPCYTSVAVLLALSLFVVCCSGQCRFEYRTQPPSSTVYDYNPYQGNDVIILLACVVRRQINVTDDFEIRWFRQNITGGVEDLGRGDLDEALGNDWLSRYRITELFKKQYNSSFAGKYWCQVINTTADPDQPLMRSNVFTLLPPDSYMYTAPKILCFRERTRLLQVFNVTCADLKVHSETVTGVRHTTTTLAAALTPSTTTCGQTGTWVYPVIALLGVVIVATSVVAVTAVLLLLRKQRQNGNHQNHQKGKCDAVKQQTIHFPTNNTEVVKRGNIRKEAWQIKNRSGQHTAGTVTEGTHPTPPPPPPHPPPHASDHHSSTSSVQHYEPLNIVNADDTSIYATPTSAGTKGTPLMEVGGNMYSIVDPTTRKDEHIYTTPQ